MFHNPFKNKYKLSLEAKQLTNETERQTDNDKLEERKEDEIL